MATYKHGVYTSEQATSMTAPVTGTAGLQVVVGTAPVNMLEHPEQAVNTPLLVYNYKEAVAAVGYHDNFAAYTLCESISAAFSVVGTGPLVLINVLDPAKHTADIAETTVQVNSGVAVLDAVGVLLDKLTVKSGSTALTRDTDYTASFNNDGTLNIVPLAGGKAASATTLTVTGKKLDPSKVKAADIVGGVDAATGKETGLEVVRQIYPKLSMTPGILLAPRFSMQIIGSAIQAAMPIIQGIITVIMTIGSVVVPALLAGFEAFSAGIGAVMSAIQGIFQGLITFITGVFSGSWSQAWEGIKQIFGSAFDGLVALCKAPLNAVIAIINKAISGINGLGLTIPEWVPILGGKSFSVNIPTLPMLARGGFTDGVSIAGEAGTEAVISFQRGVRSDNINTWTQAGRMLGVSGEQAAVAAGVPYADGGGAVELATLEATQGNNAVELQEIDTGKPQPEQDGGGTPDGGGQVVFAPQITVQGNADRAVLESVLDDAQQRFELWYEQMMRRKARTAY